ncbi:MAG: NADPH:quinone reductase [Alphaproteobacteria bacterium]|nr:NADPH:quinone reductase [Alphaproteobacteria bacterium]
MRAAFYDRLGPAREVLAVGEMPMPEAGAGELRVKIRASGVNPSDVKRRRGAGGRHGMDYPRVVPNSDAAGVVDQIGAGVSAHWLGRRVWLYNGQRGGRAFGTACEYIALDAVLVSDLPERASFAEGACLGIPGMTAHRAVFADGPVTAKTVLVTGGAGAVGHFAVQLAKWGGAHVIATVSGDAKAAHARLAGADVVINYRTENVADQVFAATGGGGLDRIVEVDFGGNLATIAAALKNGGSIAAYASEGNETPTLPFYAMMAKNHLIRLITLNNMPMEARQAAQRDLNRWLESAANPIVAVAGRFPLERIADAHEAVEKGAKLGTVIVEP